MITGKNAFFVFNWKVPQELFFFPFFFGCYGFDRFYIGDIGLGFLKLLTFGGCGIWTIIDWFKISGMTKQRNYDKILEYLWVQIENFRQFEKRLSNNPFFQSIRRLSILPHTQIFPIFMCVSKSHAKIYRHHKPKTKTRFTHTPFYLSKGTKYKSQKN